MTSSKDERPILIRLWSFQRERAPIFAMTVVALLTAGVVYKFADTPVRNFLTAAAIFFLYMAQIRAADEKKDFEHDNKYHPNRPVQRGVVSLAELKVVGQIAMGLQIILYASFLDLRILLLGVLTQLYAYLTRKEFFVRDWIRRHFFIYYVLHYIQLVILFTALIHVIKPVSVNYAQLVAFFMLNIVLAEMGRKMFAVEDDTTDDTYSAQLGHKGSAAALAVTALLINAGVLFFISGHAHHYVFAALPGLAFINLAYRSELTSKRLVLGILLTAR